MSLEPALVEEVGPLEVRTPQFHFLSPKGQETVVGPRTLTAFVP